MVGTLSLCPRVQLVLSDGLSGCHILGHLQMVAQGRQRLVSPILELRIIATLGVPLEQGTGVLLTVDLILIVAEAKVGPLKRFKLFVFSLMGVFQRGGRAAFISPAETI